MSQKVVMAAALAATAVSAMETQGFCVSYKGINVCKEQVESALESSKINITGCVTVGGVQICKNSEETGLFEEEQGFCVEFKGVKVCKEEVEMALESSKIDITGCVKVGKVEICKNSEEQEQGLGKVLKKAVKVAKVVAPLVLEEDEVALEEQGLGKVLKKAVKIAKVVGPLVLEEEEDMIEQGKFWKKLGKALKKVVENVNISVAFEEEADMEVDAEQGKFWKKLGKALKKIVENVNINVTLEEGEQAAFGEFVAHWKTIKPILPVLKNQLQLQEEDLDIEEANFLTNPKVWKVVGKVAIAVAKVFLSEEALDVMEAEQIVNPCRVNPAICLYEEEEVEQGKFWKKLGKVAKQILPKVLPLLLEEEEMMAVDAKKNQHRQLKKFVKVDHKKLTPEERLAKREARKAKWAAMTPEEKKAAIKARKARKDAKKHTKKTAPVAASLLEEEEQGFCVEWNGIKVCKEQIDMALESSKIDITGCVKVGKVEICKNAEETSIFEEEQGFCVEWNGIKVCKEQIEAAMESEKIKISGCVTIAGVQVCKQ